MKENSLQYKEEGGCRGLRTLAHFHWLLFLMAFVFRVHTGHHD